MSTQVPEEVTDAMHPDDATEEAPPKKAAKTKPKRKRDDDDEDSNEEPPKKKRRTRAVLPSRKELSDLNQELQGLIKEQNEQIAKDTNTIGMLRDEVRQLRVINQDYQSLIAAKSDSLTEKAAKLVKQK